MKNKIEFISEEGKKFLQSKWSLFFFLGSIICLSIMNLSLFGMGQSGISTIFTNNIIEVNSDNSWIGWVEITISSFGSFFTILGVILTIRFDKRFIFPLVLGETLIICDAIMIGYIFTAISYTLMLCAAFYSYFMWNKEKGTDSKVTFFMWVIIGLFFITYLGFGMTIGYETSIYRDEFGNINQYSMWTDIACSGIVVSSWFLLLRKSKWGFLGFLITDILYIILYAQVPLWPTVGSYAVYIFIDGISFISWYNTN